MTEPTRRPKIRCAIYTRKSTEEGLEQDFNSLDAQREACAAYVASQKNEGWVLLPQTYDDGGISGGTLDRPGIQQLLTDVDAGLVDQIIVYKVDRLTRSLTDFSKLVERLDTAGASFVSVTQSFNTSTSMGRLTLNMLLSFAQFEREVTTERIRDKIAASKAKGLWMGGVLPLGYTKDGRSLAIVDEEAKTVRRIFEAYLNLGDVRGLAEKLKADGVRSKPSLNGKRQGGNPYTRGMLYNMLKNPIYIGKVRHKDKTYEGQHEAIIDDETWDQVQQKLKSTNRQRQKFLSRAGETTLLHRKLLGADGRNFQLYTRRGKGTLRQYYVLPDEQTGKAAWRLATKELDNRVRYLIVHHLRPQGDMALSLIKQRPDQVGTITSALKNLQQHIDSALIDNVVLGQGQISIELSSQALKEAFGINLVDASTAYGHEESEAKAHDILHIQCPFQIKKRGLERRLILGADLDAAPRLDETLITNLGQALIWYDEIKSGKSLGSIAAEAGVSTYRVKDIVHLAFTAPDIKRSILRGSQPTHLTNQRLITTNLPLCWAEQHLALGLT